MYSTTCHALDHEDLSWRQEPDVQQARRRKVPSAIFRGGLDTHFRVFSSLFFSHKALIASHFFPPPKRYKNPLKKKHVRCPPRSVRRVPPALRVDRKCTHASAGRAPGKGRRGTELAKLTLRLGRVDGDYQRRAVLQGYGLFGADLQPACWWGAGGEGFYVLAGDAAERADVWDLECCCWPRSGLRGVQSVRG